MTGCPDENPDPDSATSRARSPSRGRGISALWSVPTYRFAILFLSMLIGIALAYPALRLRLGHQFRAVEIFTARLVYAIARLFSSEAELPQDGIVYLERFPIAVIDECTGIYEAVLLGAALLAFPTSWGKTAIGFLLGLPLIYALNVVRIVMLLFVGRYFPLAFDFMHIYFWQVTMIAMVAGTWLLWVLWVVGEGAERAERAGPDKARG
jgi:archaeosortase B (VPXXXP-CTERM-specific)